MLETVVCTISDEGTIRKNEMVEQTMMQLSDMRNSHFRVVGVHIGENVAINAMISRFCPEIQIISPPAGNSFKKLKVGMQRLFTEAKAIVREVALREKPLSIIYMEGDKNNFVQEIQRIVYPVIVGLADLSIPERSKEGFSQFPREQRFWEYIDNKFVAKIMKRDIDIMYGPRVWNPGCSEYFSECPLNDFGALTYSVVRAELEGKKVMGIKVPGFPQKNYMSKYPSIIRAPGLHFIYRAIQNLPHLYASQLAKKDTQDR